MMTAGNLAGIHGEPTKTFCDIDIVTVNNMNQEKR